MELIYKFIVMLIPITFVHEIESTDVYSTLCSSINNEAFRKDNLLESQPCNSTLRLENMAVDRQIFIKWLQNCPTLKTLQLSNISWVWNPKEVKAKVYLPNLVTFHIELNSRESFKNSAELESLIVFSQKHSKLQRRHGLQNLQGFDFLIGGNFGPGYLRFGNGSLEGAQINDSSVWLMLQDVWSSFHTIHLKYSKFKVEWINMSRVKHIYLEHNQVIDGNLGDIFKSADVANTLEVYSSKDEAIDVSLLPSDSLRSVTTWRLSFRWSSRSTINFPVLETLNMTFGDIDINLFLVSDTFSTLLLDHIHLWNSTVQDIRIGMPNINQLWIGCQFFQGICPVINLADLPSRQLNILFFNNVEITLGENLTSFKEIEQVYLIRCRIHEKVRNHFTNLFPNVEGVGISVSDVLQDPNFVQRLSTSKISAMSITVVISTTYNQLLKFINIIQNVFNTSLPIEKLGGGVGVLFTRNGTTWNHDFVAYPVHRLLRIIRLLEVLNIETSNITQSTMDWIYYSYISMVYLICSIGMICNFLCSVVLLQRAMRSSTSYLMLGLAISDFVYLFTSLFTVEEFQLLFNYEYALPVFSVYPIKLTAYTASIYITILITVERFVAICFPFQLSSLFSVQRTIRYIGSAAGFAVTLCFPCWFETIKWSYAASSSEWSSNNPRMLHRIPAYDLVYQNIIWFLFIHSIPLSSIAVLNFFIALQVRKAADKKRALASKSTDTDNNSLTKILLLVVLTFFVCNAMSGIMYWIFTSKGVEPQVVESLASLPAIINSSLNFILYYVMGTKFRKEFKTIFLYLWKRLTKIWHRTPN